MKFVYNKILFISSLHKQEKIMLNNLRKAYDDFVQGIYTPEIIALNPMEWAWLCDYYYPPQTDEPNSIKRKQTLLSINKLVSFRWSTLVFRDDIKPGVARMWRFEPHIEVRDYFLWMCSENYTPHISKLVYICEDGDSLGVSTYSRGKFPPLLKES